MGLDYRPVRAAELSDEAMEDLPGLAARLASIANELRAITERYPVFWLPAAGVGDAIEQAEAVRQQAHALTAVLASTVVRHGYGEADGVSRNDWVTAHAPTLAGGAGTAATAVGAALTEPRWQPLAHKVRSGAATVEQAAAIVRFYNDVVRVADREHLEAVVDSMVETVDVLGLKELRRLVAHARAALKPPKDVSDEDARTRAGRSLTRVGRSAGMVEYRLRLDPEAAAVLDAALDPLSRPRPDLDWDGFPCDCDLHREQDAHAGGGTSGPCGPAGPRRDRSSADDCTERSGGTAGTGRRQLSEDDIGDPAKDPHADCGLRTGRDPRAAATRRADALLELLERAVGNPEGSPRTPRTQLVITMSLESLLEQVRGAGVAGNDEVLSAETVRRLACEASIIPAMLGGPSQPLDVGHAERFFTPAQRRALAIRDKGCSIPGCTVPPQWCHAHHAVPWYLGGPTDLSNGVLLCGRHHTVVHALGLTPEILPDQVIWHLPRGFGHR